MARLWPRAEVLLCVVIFGGTAGCMMQNLSASERFSESSFVLNDAARWGRLDVVRSHVAPAYLPRYAHRHQHWGGEIQIAEADIVSLRLDEDKEGATSRVQVAWYTTSTMSLRASTIVQRWKADGQDYLLISEELKGDPQLFAADPEPAASKTSDASSATEAKEASAR